MCCGTSKANSAIVHAGYDAAEGSLMARLNVEGNQIMPELAKELDFPFNPCGSFVVCLDEESLPDLRALYERGVKNGVKDLEIITDKARIRKWSQIWQMRRPAFSMHLRQASYVPLI